MDLPRSEMRHSAPCERNQGPIGDQLARFLTPGDVVWEIGSGTGQHAAAFAARFPEVVWQPSDLPESLPSVRAWVAEAGVSNTREPLEFDLFEEMTPVTDATHVFCANTLHIAPWEAGRRLFVHAAQALKAGGLLITYGPYRYRDVPLEPSNEAFERWLKSVDPARGIRVFEDVDAEARAAGFALQADVAMPANNRLLVWRLLT